MRYNMQMYDADDSITIDSVDADRAELQRVTDYKLHEVYQVMQFDNLLKTIQNCGIDRSVLYMYNRNGELANCTNIYIPSLEEFDNGYRLTKDETNQLLTDMIHTVYFAGMEHDVNDYDDVQYDDALKIFRAGWRWFQSISGESGRLAKRIGQYINEIKTSNITKFNNATAQITRLDVLKKNMDNDIVKYRKEANDILHDLNKGKESKKDSIENAKRMSKIRDAVQTIRSHVKESVEHEIQDVNISRIPVKDLVKLGEEAIDRLNDVTEMNKTYDGFWHTGFSVGKTYALTVIGSGVVGRGPANYRHRGIIVTSSVGWQTLSYTVDADTWLCQAVAKTIRTVLNSHKAAKK